MTASTQTRVGIIGAGYIATWHADAIKATPGAQLVAVCDQSMGAAEDLARAHGVQAFGSVDDMIAAGLCDAVHILTPPSSHRDLTLQCLRAGLHVLVEKPVALSGDEADQMRAAAVDAGKVLAAGHNFLGLPSYERLKAMIHHAWIVKTPMTKNRMKQRTPDFGNSTRNAPVTAETAPDAPTTGEAI
jgi:predicted dehydrogenase